MDLTTIALDLASFVNDYWETLPDTPSLPTKIQMHDQLLTQMTAKYNPDPCTRDALSVAIDDFFTSDELDKRSLDEELDPRSLGLDPRLKIKCGKKCNKLLKRIVGTIIEVLTHPVVAKPVCNVAGGAVGVVTENPTAGYLTAFVCMDQARQEREKNEKRDKFLKLKSSVRLVCVGGGGRGGTTGAMREIQGAGCGSVA